jgi:NAD(P)-dependent dehydrogenase (short-subunit alcohol dehydrogenase family)
MTLPERPRAVITGAGSGLGRGFALEIAGRRGRVLVADIDEEGARETVRLVAQAGGEASFVRCDVAKHADVEALIGEADRAMGGVDLLINNAGVAVGGNVDAVPLADWEWIMSINLWGVIYGCRAFIPRFRQQGGGHIINVASAAGLLSGPQMGPYNVTKAGVIALSETLAAEVKEHHIRVTVLCPTFFRTQIVKNGRVHGPSDKELVSRLMDRAKVQADGVARAAIEAVSAGELYVLPHPDGRWAWRLKRALPGFFHMTFMERARRRMTR